MRAAGLRIERVEMQTATIKQRPTLRLRAFGERYSRERRFSTALPASDSKR